VYGSQARSATLDAAESKLTLKAANQLNSCGQLHKVTFDNLTTDLS
jgi:hypothetical protein